MVTSVGNGKQRKTYVFNTDTVSRLRIGHTGLNKSKTFMSKHPTGLCDWCGGDETLEHVIMHCGG